MLISTEIASAARIVGEEKAIELFAKAGFTAWDFSMFAMCRFDWSKMMAMDSDHPLAGTDYLAFARRLKQVGLDNGIVCNQSHAPFPVSSPQIQSMLKRAIECTAEAGGQICVIHPDNNKKPEENAQMFAELLPFAKEHGVKIATENMWNWNKSTDRACFAACATAESFCRHIDVINDPDFVACLDIGHAEMMGDEASAESMILSLGHRLKALHLHDNDLWHDSHALPFSMEIDFEKVVSALKQIRYDGDLTLEADRHLSHYTADTVYTGICEMYTAARKLSDMFLA